MACGKWQAARFSWTFALKMQLTRHQAHQAPSTQLMPLTAQQTSEIDTLRDEQASTRRDTAVGLEEMLYKPFPVLDHGFIRVIDYMGTDSAIVQAARVSYGRGTKRVNED